MLSFGLGDGLLRPRVGPGPVLVGDLGQAVAVATRLCGEALLLRFHGRNASAPSAKGEAPASPAEASRSKFRSLRTPAAFKVAGEI